MGIGPTLHFAVPVWGQNYVETFLQFCLPAQLSPDNIPALGRNGDHTYTIYTTLADKSRIERAPSYRALQKHIAVRIELLDADHPRPDNALSIEKYGIKSECYRRALHRAADGHSAVVALNADILLANGFVSTVIALLSRGKRVIEVPGPRGLRDPIVRELAGRYLKGDGTVIDIQPTELAALWLEHMHPQLQMHFVEGPEGAPFHPSHLYWSVGRVGVIVRGFHLYPIVIDPGAGNVAFTSTIDDDLVANLNLSPAEVFLAQDSRDIFCCELSPQDHYVGHMATRGDLARYVDFYLSYTRQNIGNLDKEIIISGERELGPQWKNRRMQSAKFAASLLRRYRIESRRRVWKGNFKRITKALLSPLRGGALLTALFLKKILPPPVKRVLRFLRAAAGGRRPSDPR